MYAADARTTAAIRRHRSEQLRTRRPRQERILTRLRVALTARTTAEAAAPANNSAPSTAGQPAC